MENRASPAARDLVMERGETRFVEYYNHERLHEAIPQMGARTLSKKIGPTVPEDLTTYTRQKSLFDEEEPEPSCFCD